MSAPTSASPPPAGPPPPPRGAHGTGVVVPPPPPPGGARPLASSDERVARPERGWHYRRSLASRVTLLTTIAVGLAVAALSTGVYLTARAQLRHQLDDSLLERAKTIVGTGEYNSPEEYRDTRVLLFPDANIFLLQDQSGRPAVTASTGEPLPLGRPELEVAEGESSSSVRTLYDDDGDPYRVVAVPTQVSGRALVLAQSQQQQDALLSQVGTVSLFFGLAGVLGAGIAGWAVARNGLRPVRRLTASVERIAETEDLRTIPVEGDDEIARLAAAFNEMLVSLDASRTRQRQLVTDAGHELRTPLTSLRTNVDLLVQSEEAGTSIEPDVRREMLGDIGAQIDELTTLIGDLTELARDEPLAPVVGTVDLAEVVEIAAGRVRRRAAGSTFDVVLEPWEVLGEADALERAVTNLLDNAAKWGPDEGTVTVRLREGELSVDDQGPGIDPKDRQRVFDRFWRAEEARTMPGSGLGLSIVRQVAERHHGSVRAEAAPGGGARLVMRLPGEPG